MTKWKRMLSCVLSGAMILGSFPVQAQELPAADVSGNAAVSENIVIHTDADEVYVSHSGNDSNPGTFAEPLKTIGGARDLVRGMNDDMERDIVVYLEGGTYYQDKPLSFAKEDSGTNGHVITYRSYGDETAVISGGQVLTGWELADEEKGIYKMTWEDAPEGFDTRQLYVDGVRAARAKGSLPGAGFNKAIGAYTTNMDMINWKNPKNIEFVYYAKWTAPRVLVESITVDSADPNRLLITMNPYMWPLATNKGSSSLGNGPQGNKPQWIENAYELLDEPGEWYLDKTGDVGDAPNTFYYKPLDDQNMDRAEVIAPVLEEVMRIESDNIDEPVSNLQFQGVSFQHATWLRPNQMGGVSDGQDNNIREASMGGDKSTGGNVFLNRTRNIVFNSCEFAHMGNAALYMHQGNKDNLVNGCHFYDISSQAVKIGDVDCDDPLNFYLPRYPESSYEPGDPRWYTVDDWDWRYVQTNNDVTNNIIHDTAMEFFSSAAVAVVTVEETDISHNEIYNTAYAGLHIGYGWGGWKDMMSPMGNNKMQYNYIHDTMQVLYDAGSIYLNGSQYGTSSDAGYVRKTVISDNFLTEQVNMFGAVYLDDGANYYEITNNVVKDVPMFLSNKHPRNDIHHNYSNQTYYTNTGATWDPARPGAVHDNTFVDGDNFPQEALDIMANAGLEEGYSHDHFDCRVVDGDVTLEYDSENGEYPLSFITNDVTGVRESDSLQLFLNSKALAGKECKAMLGDVILTGTGDVKGKVLLGAPIPVKDISGILTKAGITLKISMPELPQGKTTISAGWQKIEGDKTQTILSAAETIYLLNDFSGYDQNLKVNLADYDLGKITPNDNPDKITYNDALGVTLDVKESEEDGRYIHFNKPVKTGSSYTWEIPVKSTPNGTVIVKGKIKLQQTNSKTYGLIARNSNQNMGLTFMQDGRLVHEYASPNVYDLMPYAGEVWYDMTLVMDMDQGIYDAIVNNKLVKEDTALSMSAGRAIEALYFGMFSAHTGSFDIKDIAVYSSRTTGAVLNVAAAPGSQTELNLSVSGTRYIPEGAKARFRVTMPENTKGQAVFTGIADTDNAVTVTNGAALSASFDFPAADGKLDASVILPLNAGTHIVKTELLYELDGGLYPLAAQNTSMTVISDLQTVFELDLSKYELGRVTNDTNNPDNAAVNGNPDTSELSVVEEDGERALKFSKTDKTTALELRIPVEASGKTIEISADVKVLSGSDILYTLMAVSDKAQIAYLFHNAGKIAIIPYKAFGGYPVNTWHNIKLQLDTESRTYSIYVDNELRGTGIPMDAATPNPLTKITEITSQIQRSQACTYYLKNIKVADTSAAEASHFQMDLSQYALGRVTNETNNPDNAAINGSPDTSELSVVEEDGARALKFSKTDNTTALEMRFPIHVSGDFIDISAEVKVTSGSSVLYTFIPYAGDKQVGYLFHNAGKVAIIPYKAFGAYPVNQWHNIKLHMDMKAQTYSIYVNEELRGSGIAFASPATTLTEITTQIHRGSAATYFFKNLDVKGYTAPEDTEVSAGAEEMTAVSVASPVVAAEAVYTVNELEKAGSEEAPADGFAQKRAEFIQALREQGAKEEAIDLFRRLTMADRFGTGQFSPLWNLVQALSNAEAVSDADLAALDLIMEDTELVDSVPLGGGQARPAAVEARFIDRNTHDLVITVRRDTVKNKTLIRSIEDLEITIKKGTEFTLPETVEAVMSDGSKQQVAVTWDGEADPATAGVVTFKGTVADEEYPGTVLFTLTVEKVTYKISVSTSVIGGILKDGVSAGDVSEGDVSGGDVSEGDMTEGDVLASADVYGGTVIPDKTEAEAGETVSLTVECADGYRLVENSLKANDGDVVITDGKFEMPAEDVLVTAQFEAIPASAYLVIIPAVENGSIWADPMSGTPGTSIHLTVTPDSGYRLAEGSLKVMQDDGTEVAVNADNTFALPEGNVTVTASFEKNPTSGNIYRDLLQSVYDYAKDLSTEGVVDSAAKQFRDTLAKAKSTLDNQEAADAQLEEAFDELLEVIWGLGLVKGDKTELAFLIVKAEIMVENQDKYVAAQWELLLSKLAAAKELMANGDAMEEDIEHAADELLEAILKQRFKARKDILEDLLNKAETVDESLYTEESVQVFRAAFAYAKGIMENDDLSEDDQAAVDQAAEKLGDAIGQLVKKDDTEIPTDPDDPSNPNDPADPGKPSDPNDPSDPGNPSDPDNSADPSTPSNDGSQTSGEGNSNTAAGDGTAITAPKTGDYTNIGMALSMTALGIACVGFVAVKMKKRED